MTVKLLMLLGGNQITPSTRRRVYEVADHLPQWDVVPHIHGPLEPPQGPLAMPRRLATRAANGAWLASELLRHDVVFLQRSFLPPRTIDWIRALNSRIIYSFDDAWFTSQDPTQHNAPEVVARRARLDHALRSSALVLVPNQHLADYVARHNPQVAVWPVPVDTNLFVPVAKSPRERPVIGWHGMGEQHLRYLQVIREVLDRLAPLATFAFRLIGAQGSLRIRELFAGAPYPVEIVDWADPRSEMPAAIADLDIGMVPLLTDNWSRGKFPAKAVEYMAVGVPMVCTPVGIDLSLMKDGVNCMLAATPEEWVAKLKALVESAALREQLGAAARQMAVRHYSFEVVCRQFAEHARRVAAQPRFQRLRHAAEMGH